MKRTVLRTAAALSTLLALGAAGGCSSEASDREGQAAAVTKEPDGKLGPQAFRQIFGAYLSADHRREDIDELVFLPPDGIMEAKTTGTLESVDERFARALPSDWYEAGKKQKEFADAEVLERHLEANPVHVVIVPGIFSEMIPKTPYEEIFAADSSARRAWEKTVDELAKARDPLATDKRYSLDALGEVDASMKDLVRVGSIDSRKTGKPLVTIAYLRAQLGSLEDFGTLEEDNSYYLERLDKYFKLRAKIDGQAFPKHLYVMGYSRGTPVALDLVARAKRVAHGGEKVIRRDYLKLAHGDASGTEIAVDASWVDHVRGVITLAGVVYGSQLADVLEDPSKPQGEIHASVMSLSKPGVLNGLGEGVAQCAVDWVRVQSVLGKTLVDALPLLGAKHHEIGLEGISPERAKLGSLLSFFFAAVGLWPPSTSAIEVIEQLVDGAPASAAEKQRALDALKNLPNAHLEPVLRLDFRNFFAQGCENTRRFRILLNQVMKGAETLTTTSRLDWYANNELPSDIRYFSITGTMGNTVVDGVPWEEAHPESPVVTNPVAYDKASIDFNSLRGNYYDLVQKSQGRYLFQVNDSQVQVQRGRFWPNLAAAGGGRVHANGDQLKTYFMGTVGVHHWGLSFPRAFSTNDGLEANPFPRTTLMKAMATFVVEVEKTERK
jgi:hypothetical protein